jgi:predicted lipid-binding transport protein (Tim44 family)
MQKLLFIITLILLSFSLIHGQTSNDSIRIEKVFGSYTFYQEGRRLNLNQLAKTMKSNPEAYKHIKKARSNYTGSMILGYAGGFMVGWPLGTAIAGGEPNWIIAGIGAGIIVASIPFTRKTNEQAKKAVELYNRGEVTGSYHDKPKLEFALNRNGIGFRLIF